MYNKLIYNGEELYQVVRTISMDDCNPKKYGIPKEDQGSFMKVLQVWRDQYNCDHVLKRDNKFMLCRTIKDAQIIE
tara:strand:- start:7408 stop:7635 length:228 start_codon:yes stop_codon:yes gene_type:complete